MITENGKGCRIIIVGPMCQGVSYVEITQCRTCMLHCSKNILWLFCMYIGRLCMFAVVLAKHMKDSISHFYPYCLHNRNLSKSCNLV